MKLFGDYLVERKLISNQVLAEVLIEQLKSIPSTAEVVFEYKLLSTDQILAVLRKQTEAKKGFVEAARDLELWSEDIARRVEEVLGVVRIPLGQLLINSGKVSIEQITDALDHFLSEAPKNT
jgi:hypothetical protein